MNRLKMGMDINHWCKTVVCVYLSIYLAFNCAFDAITSREPIYIVSIVSLITFISF